jgi:biotin operon repressor
MNQRDRVRVMLEQAGGDGVTTGDFLAAYLPRFSARIKELRDEGLSIETTRLKGSSSRYTLRPGEKASPVVGARGESVALGASEREPRGDGSNCGLTKKSQRQNVAVTSGKGCGVPGGDGSRAVTATPTLFQLDADRPSNYYEGEAA